MVHILSQECKYALTLMKTMVLVCKKKKSIFQVQTEYQQEKLYYKKNYQKYLKGLDSSTMERMLFILQGHQNLLKDLDNLFPDSVMLHRLTSTTFPVDIADDVVGHPKQLLPLEHEAARRVVESDDRELSLDIHTRPC